jgi:hypothetical protein
MAKTKRDRRQTNNGLQNTAPKTEDRATRTALSIWYELMCCKKLAVLVPLAAQVMFLLNDTNIILNINSVGYLYKNQCK